MITIHLDSKIYRKIDEYKKRFSKGVPSLIDCRSLTIEGDVAFEKNVILKGEAAIRNRTKSQVVIPCGCIIEGELIFA
jgi:UTP--glucose-1-phosphate uridylyltransferase